MNKALVIGLGMGSQYVQWLNHLGFAVKTVDPIPEKMPDYTNHIDAISECSYDLIYIGTPNFTHEAIARDVAESTKLLIIEKPGVKDSDTWKSLIEKYPSTRIAMVKNNQYRSEISGYENLAALSSKVKIVWSRKDGVPTSSWFKDKDRSFGGVSRDLMPHLLSYYTRLTKYSTGAKLVSTKIDTNNTGIDDFCSIEYKHADTHWELIASWKNNQEDEHYIEFTVNDRTVRFELGDYITAFGGCPATPYMNMILNFINNIDNNEFWLSQNHQDCWIHHEMETL